MTYIIADIGGNICNDLDKGKRLIDAAKECGADAVKLQVYRYSDLYYHEDDTQHLHYQNVERLFDYAKQMKIDIFSSVFSFEAIEFLHSIGCRDLKIAAFEANRFDLIDRILSYPTTTLHVSLGLLNPAELNKFHSLYNNERVIAYHSVSKYDGIKLKEFSLFEVEMYEGLFHHVGFSDHTESYLPACIAIGMGATYIEKHLRLSEICPEKFALLPEGFKIYCKKIREASYMVERRQLKQEYKLKNKIFAVSDIKVGDIFTAENIKCFRNKTEEKYISATHYKSLLGKKSNIDIRKGDVVCLEMSNYYN